MNRILIAACTVAILFACASSPQQVPSVARPEAGTRQSQAPTPSQDALAPVGGYRIRSTLVLEEGGRVRRTFEERYEILSASAPTYFSHHEAWFDPNQDDPPDLSARVILPDGTVRTLDPGTITEAPAGPSGPRNLSDQRRRIAPLPSLVPGSVVERRWSRTTSRPIVNFGQSWALLLATPIPTEQAVVVVEHPRSLPVHTSTTGTAVEPVQEEDGDRVRLTWTQGHPPITGIPDERPPQARVEPRVFVTTAESWQAVARGYLELIRPALDPAPLQPLAKELGLEALAPRDAATRALDWMHHHLRYTGLDFDNGGIVPAKPPALLERGFGDCKDLAAFLVALLDAAGVEAKIALVNISPWADWPLDIPGTGRFDHAIVLVPGAEPIWIDPTLRGLPPGVLSGFTADRLALLIDGDTTGPIRTPVSSADHNQLRIVTEITLPDVGEGHVHMVRTVTGSAVPGLRHRAITQPAEVVHQEITQETLRSYASSDLTYRHSDPLSALHPFEETLEIRNSAVAQTTDRDAVAPLGLRALADFVPGPLLRAAVNGGATEAEAGDLFLGTPSELIMTTRIKVHPLYVPRSGRVERGDSVGGFHWSYAVEPRPDGAEATVRVRFDEAVIRASDLPAVHRSLKELLQQKAAVHFDNRIFRLLADGKVQEAARDLRHLERDEPENVWLRSLLARTALAAGLGNEARRLAKEAAAAAPESPYALRTLGHVLTHDEWGRFNRQGLDRSGALAALSRVLELTPDSTWARKMYVEMLARNDEGKFTGPGEDSRKALDELRSLMASDRQQVGLFHALLWEHGLDEELIGEGQKSTDNYVLAAVARKNGVDAALTLISSLPGHTREAMLSAVALELYRSRQYELARALAPHIKNPEFTGLRTLLEKTARRDATPFRPGDPLDVFVETVALATGGAARVAPTTVGVREEDEFLATQARVLLSRLSGSKEVALDALHSIAEASSPRSIPGIGVLVSFQSALHPSVSRLFEETPTGLRLHEVQSFEEQIDEAWKAWREGKPELAKAWLDVYLELNFLPKVQAQVSTIRRLLAESGDNLPVALALAYPGHPGSPQERLRALERAVQSPPRHRGDVSALGSAYLAALTEGGSYDEAVRTWTVLYEKGSYLHEEWALKDRLALLRSAQRADDLEAIGREMLERDPKDAFGFRFLTAAASLKGDPVAYREANLRSAEAGIEVAISLNNVAWSAIHLGVTHEDVRYAERSLAMNADNNATMDTLSALLVEVGEIDRALTILSRLEEADKGVSPSGIYVRARIAESLGFRDAAIELYDRVEPASNPIDDLQPLARKHRERLSSTKR